MPPDGLRKNTKNLSQESRTAGRDLNKGCHKYLAEVSQTSLQRLVIVILETMIVANLVSKCGTFNGTPRFIFGFPIKMLQTFISHRLTQVAVRLQLILLHAETHLRNK
jgi:hypothetical protein